MAGRRDVLKMGAAVILCMLLSALAYSMAARSPKKPAAAGQSPSQLTKVVLAQNPVPHSALAIIAKKKGFFEEEGLDVEVKEFTTGKLCFDAMLGGGAEFSTVAETPLMYAGFSDQPVCIVATIMTSPETLKIVARKDKGVEKPADLKGKMVGTFKGGNAEYFLAQFLKKNGMTMQDLKVTFMQPPELIAAFTRGDLVALSMWEPHAYNAQRAVGENAVVFADKDLYVETFNIVVMRKFADEKGVLVEKFVRALRKAEQFLKVDQNAAKDVLVGSTAIQKDVLDHIWPYFRLELSLDTTLVDMMTKEAHFAIESGARPAGTPIPDYRKMVERRFLDGMK